MTRCIFTLSAGRTGTGWLADFLSENLGFKAVHEPLEIEDFGVRMPDIRLMRGFNTFGNSHEVRQFWNRKFAGISGETYVETNHALGKCGLIENLGSSNLAEKATVIVLRRDLVRQCASYIMRGDFKNITTPWQWYLVPSYPRRLLNHEPFEPLGELGYAIWYCLEMATRQSYYIARYSDRIRFIEADLNHITKVQGARAFLGALGKLGDPTIPSASNTSAKPAPSQLITDIQAILTQLDFDPDEAARAQIARGFDFERVSGGYRETA